MKLKRTFAKILSLLPAGPKSFWFVESRKRGLIVSWSRLLQKVKVQLFRFGLKRNPIWTPMLQQSRVATYKGTVNLVQLKMY